MKALGCLLFFFTVSHSVSAFAPLNRAHQRHYVDQSLAAIKSNTDTKESSIPFNPMTIASGLTTVGISTLIHPLAVLAGKMVNLL